MTGTGSGGVVDGEAYDMVIPVEIEQPGTGQVRKLEIGYNQGQNPFTVAQEFIDKHMLDQSYLRQIADYITQRSSDYRPPIIESADTQVTTGGATGASSHITKSFQYFPPAAYNTFETTKIAKLMSTLQQFNEKLNGEEANQRLTDLEIEKLEQICKTVQETAFYHSSSFSKQEFAALRKVLMHWPSTKVFPALDLARLVVFHPQGAALLGISNEPDASVLLRKILELGTQEKPSAAAAASVQEEEEVPIAARMLALRVLANMFMHQTSRETLLQNKEQVLSALVRFGKFPHKLMMISLATVVLKYVVIC